MPTRLKDALHSWLEAEAAARETERTLASAISQLNWREAQRLPERLNEQRSYASEMLLTTMELMVKQ